MLAELSDLFVVALGQFEIVRSPTCQKHHRRYLFHDVERYLRICRNGKRGCTPFGLTLDP